MTSDSELAEQCYRFSKNKRLLTPEDYQAVFKEPIKSKSFYFTVLTRPNHLTTARLGLIIAKKVIRQAVQRNRVKRLIRESFRLHQHSLIGLDIVVLAGRGYKGTPENKSIQDRLTWHWQDVVTLWKKG